MGEFDFIETIRRSFRDIGDGAIVGIGDDCAVFPPADGGSYGTGRDAAGDTGAFADGKACGDTSGGGTSGEATVVTTDMLVEGVHFLREATSARELGAKSLAVNLSDVAAMGARPVASLLSIALPAECRGAWADEFMAGYREMSARHGVRLAGGDTTASLGGVAVNVVAIGRAPTRHLKYRSGARAGDVVAVCGALGGSAAGLADVLAGRLDTPFAHLHRNPEPQVAEGEWLGARAEVHAMIDLSDGLASDLVHILRASGVGATVELGSIPAAASTARNGARGRDEAREQTAAIEPTASVRQTATIEQAVAGGEDYKLLFTVAAEAFESLAADYRARFGECLGAELHPVGRIVAGPPEIAWLEGGAPVTRRWRGFTHF